MCVHIYASNFNKICLFVCINYYLEVQGMKNTTEVNKKYKNRHKREKKNIKIPSLSRNIILLQIITLFISTSYNVIVLNNIKTMKNFNIIFYNC